jgi:hypothetical protein
MSTEQHTARRRDPNGAGRAIRSRHGELMTPAAILLGSVIIAAGLHLGLQRAAPPPVAPATAVDRTPPASGSPARAALANAGPAARSELRRRVEADAARGLEARRADFVKRCWEPSLEKDPNPPAAKYIFNMSFDESGKEIARGISEVRGMERPDAARCLRTLPLGVDVPAPGARVGIEVEITLP